MSDIFKRKYPIYINDIYQRYISSHPDSVLSSEPDDHRTLPLSPKGGSKTQIGRFRCKIALCLIVCYKVSFCENCQR